MRAAGLDVTGLGVAHHRQRRRRPAGGPRLLEDRVGHRRSSAPATPWRSACCTRAPSAACGRARDIGVVGFDDSLAAQVTWPGLTSVRQPLEQVAVELVRILHLVLAHKPIGDQGRMLEPTLVVRRSSLRDGLTGREPGQ